jgi:aspartokinase
MRFSRELVQIHIAGLQADKDVLTALLHALAERKINLFSLSFDGSLGMHANLCMAKGDFTRAQKVIDDLLQPLKAEVFFYDSVGNLALFPHQSRFRFAALALSILGENKLPVYGMSSSISALSYNTDYHLLDQAADLLQTVFQLPENHTPFRQHLAESIARKQKGTCQNRPFVETAASYWEPVIKIYGSNIKTDLELITVRVSQSNLPALKSRCMHGEDPHGCFELVIAHPLPDDALQLAVLYGREREKSIQRLLFDMDHNHHRCLTEHVPVELLYLHGPHFQDRFGVANKVFSALQKHHIHPLAAGCSGTSIYLVIPEKMARVTGETLANIFHVPNLAA